MITVIANKQLQYGLRCECGNIEFCETGDHQYNTFQFNIDKTSGVVSAACSACKQDAHEPVVSTEAQAVAMQQHRGG